MPRILKRLVGQLKDKGKSEDAAFAIATSALQRSGNLKSGTASPTAKGIKRGEMTPSERAKDRAAKYAESKPSDYTYNNKTNRATRRKA